MSHEKAGTHEVLNTVGDQGEMRLENATASDLNTLYLDTSFAGAPAQCDPETCQLLADTVDFAPTQGLADSYQYKYMMDVRRPPSVSTCPVLSDAQVDGNGCARSASCS
jgi:hypothetical protein